MSNCIAGKYDDKAGFTEVCDWNARRSQNYRKAVADKVETDLGYLRQETADLRQKVAKFVEQRKLHKAQWRDIVQKEIGTDLSIRKVSRETVEVYRQRFCEFSDDQMLAWADRLIIEWETAKPQRLEQKRYEYLKEKERQFGDSSKSDHAANLTDLEMKTSFSAGKNKFKINVNATIRQNSWAEATSAKRVMQELNHGREQYWQYRNNYTVSDAGMEF